MFRSYSYEIFSLGDNIRVVVLTPVLKKSFLSERNKLL